MYCHFLHSVFLVTFSGFILHAFGAHLSPVLMQVELDTAHQQAALLNQQKELLKERLETMSDYSDLERDKTELKGQVHLLKNQLLEAQEEVRLLSAGLDRLLSRRIFSLELLVCVASVNSELLPF